MAFKILKNSVSEYLIVWRICYLTVILNDESVLIDDSY